jgi:hypothetical protein
MDTNTVRKALAVAYPDVHFKQSKSLPYIWWTKVDGTMRAVLISSADGGFADFALNDCGLERIVDAESAGKIAKATVLYIDVAENGAIREFGKRPAKDVLAKIREEEPRSKNSVLGMIWIFPRAFFGLSAPEYNEPF